MRNPLLLAILLLSPALWAADFSLPEYERIELPNGAVLLLSEKHDVPLIGLQAVVRGGSVADPVGQGGLAELLATVMQKGAGSRDAATLAEAAASVGGQLSVDAGVESITVSAEFLSRDAALMIELVADILQRPTLSKDEFAKERSRTIDLIKAAKDSDPSALMPSYGNAFLFPGHPYGNPTYGSESSLAGIEHEDLMQFYGHHFGGDRLILAAVGDFDLAAMKAALAEAFEGWAPAGAALPELAEAEPVQGRRVLLVDKPGATQTYFWIGNVGVPVNYEHRAALNVANTVFGGRFTSMLMTELRVKSGLTYGASSTLDRRAKAGSVTIRSFTETGTTVAAIDMALDVLERLHVKGLDEEMIASARNYIMGQFPPGLETASSLARMFAFLEMYGLDRSYIDDYGPALEGVTPVTVHNTISEVYPRTDSLAFILIGDADRIREAVAKYGEITEMSITDPSFSP
ncbi:MAG: pitrilysin family protein [Woeseiaceae bacterium]